MLRVLFLVSLFSSALIGRVISHEEKGEWSCNSDLDIRVAAGFRPGIVTLDGSADDWKDIDGFEFSLLPALDPDAENEYKAGKMTVKVIFFVIQMMYELCYAFKWYFKDQFFILFCEQ